MALEKEKKKEAVIFFPHLLIYLLSLLFPVIFSLNFFKFNYSNNSNTSSYWINLFSQQEYILKILMNINPLIILKIETKCLPETFINHIIDFLKITKMK